MNKQGEELAKRITIVEVKLDEHCKAQTISDGQDREDHGKLFEKIDSLPEKLAARFANKNVEDRVSNLDNRFWAAIITALISLGIAIVGFLLNK